MISPRTDSGYLAGPGENRFSDFRHWYRRRCYQSYQVGFFFRKADLVRFFAL